MTFPPYADEKESLRLSIHPYNLFAKGEGGEQTRFIISVIEFTRTEKNDD